MNLTARDDARLRSTSSLHQVGDNRGVPSPESVRRRQSGVLVVGMVEPEVTPWLRAAGHLPRTVRDAKSAVKMLEDDPADLGIVERLRDETCEARQGSKHSPISSRVETPKV